MIVVFYRVDQIFLVELTKAFVDHRFSIRDLSEGVGGIVEEIATGDIDFFAPLIRIVESHRICGDDSTAVANEEVVISATAPLASTSSGTPTHASHSAHSSACRGIGR